MLNYKLLIVCICIIIALTLYLFYWNRFVGYALGRILRLLFWNQGESSIWVNIGSIHVSILAGRILVKDVTYHSSNQTIRIVKGQISWRYWIRVPAGEEDLSHARVVGEDVGLNTQKAPLSCRLHVSVQGLEWFIYNRTAAYDAVASAMESNMQDVPDGGHGRVSGERIGSLRKIFSWTSVVPESTHLGPPVSLVSSIYSRTPQVFKTWAHGIRNQLPNLDPKDLLPIGLEVTKGAIICGNASTPNLLVAEFRSSRGTYGIIPARSKYDQYKQVLNLTFQSANISLAENTKFEEPMIDAGEKLQRDVHKAETRPMRPFSYLSFAAFAKLWRRQKMWNKIPRPQTSHHPLHNTGTWPRRRPREIDEEVTPLGINFTTLEYAKETKILEAPFLDLLYYADSVGEVPNESDTDGPRLTEDPMDIGNGDLAPEWGIDLAIRGGVLRYGPWTDRQRAILQQAFFPPSFTESVPMTPLKPGDARVWPCMKILIELRDGVMLQIPFREASKNWQWDGEVHVPNRPRKREPASIHVRAGDSSTISYMMPMIATPRGYEPTLHVHLDTVTITSSLNDIRILTADSCVVRAEMPSPLKWNDQRQWTFAINLRQPVFYLLRDHINMFTDLSKDWASGPPSSYDRFIPMLYKVEIDMSNYELNTYVNDHNIIDKPLIREENALLTLYGKKLQNQVIVPMTRYRPDATTVSFWIEAPDVQLRLTLPRWNTRSLYSAPHRNSDIGRIGFLRMDASYSYFAEVHPENIDQLKLSFETQDVVYKGCGWTIRHFMILRNNYFGSFTHFSTLYEYLEKRKQGQPLGDPVDLQYREGSSNALQIQLEVSVNSGLVVLPVGLRGYESDQAEDQEGDIGTCVILSLPELQIHLRTHDYYMELALNNDTISGSVHAHCPEDLRHMRAVQRGAKESFILDGLDIVAHRLFGPQPHTATYLCIWDIHLSRVMVHLTALEARILAAAGSAFALNFTDPLNAPAAEYDIPVDPDVTFLKIALDEATVVWHADNAAVEVRLPEGFRMDSNDLAGKLYSKVTSFRVPDVSVKFLLAKSPSSVEWHEAANLSCDAHIDIYTAPIGWREKAQAQAEFLAAQDGHTCRALFLYMPDETVPNDTLAPGRGVLDTDLYLPQLRIPGSPVAGRVQSRKKATKSRGDFVTVPERQLRGRLRGKSESDNEEYISEADRDARLARSRPPAAFHRGPADDDSMSSGDEEDDESSEVYATDSDDDEVADVWPSLRDYGSTVRRYESRVLAHPSLWHQSPYTLTRDPTLRNTCSLKGKLATWDCDDYAEADWEDVHLDFDDTSDASITRITMYKAASVLVTPLILPVVMPLLDDVKHHLNSDLRFDGLIGHQVRSVVPEDRRRRQASALDLHVSALHIGIAQSVSEQAVAMDHSPHISARHSDSLALIDLILSDLRLKTCNVTTAAGQSESNSVALEFGRFACGIDTTNVSTLPWHLLVGPSKFSLINDGVHLSLGCLYTETRYLAPELLVPTILVTLRLVDRLRTSIQTFAKYTNMADQHVILEAIRLVGNRTALDPLSTTQPSYLIQSGRPHQLRTDIGFRYLVFLRRCYEALGKPQLIPSPDHSPRQQSAETLEYTTSLVQNCLLQLGADLDSFSFPKGSPLHFLETTSLPQQVASAPGINTCSLKFHRIHTVYSSPDDHRSEVVVAPAVVNVRIQMGEWFEPHAVPPAKSATTLSLGDKAGQRMRHFSVIVSLGDVTITFYPSLANFAQHIIRVMKVHKTGLFANPPKRPPEPRDNTTTPPSEPACYIDVVLSTNSFRVKAGAQNLMIEYRALGVDYVCNTLVRPRASQKGSLDLSMNHSLIFKEARLQGCALADMSQPDDYAVLAALIFSGGKLNILARYQSDVGPSIRIALGLSKLHLTVPRSAIRLYRFMQEWREDYLPGIEETFRALLAELKPDGIRSSTPTPVPSQSASDSPWLPRNVEVSVGSFLVSLQVMRGTWIAWEAGGIMAYMAGPLSPRGAPRRNYGMQIGYQTFIISSKDRPSDSTPNVRVKLPLPTFTSTGLFDGNLLDGLVLIEAFSANVKPSHWDTLLAVQQKFGQDFSDLISFIEDSRTKPSTEKNGVSSPPLKYCIRGKMKGFSIGLEGGSSAVLLECDHIGGTVTQDGSGLSGQIDLSDLALSLALRSNPSSPVHSFDRSRRSAFVIIDLRAEMGRSKDNSDQLVSLAVTKIHAVMQPSSIGQLGDFVDDLRAEISIREEQRAQDLAEFKEKTKTLLRSLELTTNNPRSESMSWLDKYIINVTLKNIGVAFPLAFDEDFNVPRAGRQGDGSVRAFLFSIKSISFGTHRGETGQASMKGFSFQFVPRFRQSDPADFSGDSHATRNRLVYPEMTAQLKSVRQKTSRQLHIAADVDGFILDLDSTIPDYVSSLIEVYRQGKDRVDRLSGVTSSRFVPKEAQDTGRPAHFDYSSSLTTNVFMSLKFRSGRVRMFNQAYSSTARPRVISNPSHHEPLGGHFGDLGSEVFNLPEVTVWGEYRATPAAAKSKGGSRHSEPSTLVFKSTIHSSQNTLRPSLLPFLTEVISHVETRMKKASTQDSRRMFNASSPAVSPALLSRQLEGPPTQVTDSVSSMQISLSLRIDQSKLELTCQPDVNVIAGLHWDSGGFVVNISPGAHRVTFSGTVGGLTVGLKHGFLSEDCVSLHARNLAFTMDFAKARGATVSSVSVVCDTEFSGGVRFSRLQDILCFKAVWLDRIPVLNVQPATPAGLSSRSTSHLTAASSTAPKQELTTALLVRLRKVSLDVDLGQAISSIHLDVCDAVLRTKVMEQESEVALSVSELHATATGNLAGHVAVPNFYFQTMRKKERNLFNPNKSNMLDLRMTSGPLDVTLESEYQKLLLYRAEPLVVRIYDDWSMFGDNVATKDKRIRLTFTVEGTDLTAIMNVGTIPKLASYANKFKATLDAQKEGASRESQAFRQSNPSKPENPLSDVANAMLISARTRLAESEMGFACVIGQRLSLKLDSLKLVIFPRNMRDPELAQFIGSHIHARLDRLVESEARPPKRDLHLSFSSISISKLTHLNLGLVSKEQGLDRETNRWLAVLTKDAAEATIFSLPSMDMRMHSDEYSDDGNRILPYDFSSRFSEERGMKDEDIYITLNMSLYSWLTILRKTFAREMEQVQASSEVRPPIVGLAQPAALRRSKAPEPLVLVPDREKETSAGSAGTTTDDAVQSPRRATLTHSRSTPARYSILSPTTSEFNLASPVPNSVSPSSAASGTRGAPTITVSPVEETGSRAPSPGLPANKKAMGIIYRPRSRTIERLTMRQLGEATPDVMHPFFMKTSGFSLEDSLPQYVHEYATMPTEEIMKALLKLYSKQLRVETVRDSHA